MTQQWMLQHLSIVHCIHLRPERSAKVSKDAASSSKTGNSAAEAETAEQSLLGKELDVEESDVSKGKGKELGRLQSTASIPAEDVAEEQMCGKKRKVLQERSENLPIKSRKQ